MRKSAIILLAAASAALLLGSCSDNPAVLRIDWQPDGNGYVQFRTNDASDYNHYFTHIPTDIGNALPPAGWTAEVDLVQEDGSFYGGYGLVIYNSTLTTMDAFIIDADGRYRLIQGPVSGPLSPATAWTASSYINRGNDATNTIRAVYDGASDISFYINGHLLSDYFNGWPSSITAQGGLINFILDGDKEGFPDYYSDRRFKLRITSPTSYTYPAS